MNEKNLRQMLADTLDMLARLLPTANEAFTRSHAIYLATASQDPKRAILIDSHFERLSKSSKGSIDQVLLAIESCKAKLNNDSLWST
jgi:hypothetical protein